MRFTWTLLFIISWSASAHEIQSTTQHIWLHRQKKSGWIQTLRNRVELKRNFSIGGEGTYLERFGITDKQIGALTLYRPTPRWSLELRYLQGRGNKILPEKQTTTSAWYALEEGLSPFTILRDSRYSLTVVQTAQVGVEIEKIPHFIFIPTVMRGKATFSDSENTESVFSYGLRVIYYTENKYSFSVFGSQGREAAQGIVGQSSIGVNTLSAGFSAACFFSQELKGEFIFDQTDYKELKTQFTTSTLNLTWMF